MEDTSDMMKLLIPAVVVMIGWIISHQFSSWRDRENRRREHRLNYLIDAFRSISKASHHPALHEIAQDIERAVSDIQFLGSQRQIKAAQEFANSLAGSKKADLDPLLTSLRDELRREVGREPFTGPILWLKISKGKPNSETNGDAKDA
jgi:hypothetical protein